MPPVRLLHIKPDEKHCKFSSGAFSNLRRDFPPRAPPLLTITPQVPNAGKMYDHHLQLAP